VVEALRVGDSYGSTGPRILEVHTDDNGVEIRCTPAQAIHVTTSRENGASVTAGRGGRRCGRILETDGAGLITRAFIEVPGDVGYRRVRVVGAAADQAWTNVL
jgi:hypothetical protein